MNTAERAKQARARIDSAWQRTDDKDPNTSDVDQAEAKAKGAATQRDWDQRAKPTPNRDRLAQPRELQFWERSTDDAVKRERGDSKDEVPPHVIAACPPGRRPVKRADGGYTFELIGGTRTDSKPVKAVRQG
jgi:hypothetical protein